LDRIW